MAYLLDSNVFTEAVRRYYRPSICPGFWDWLDWNTGSGQVFSIAKVGEELRARGDWLSEWAAGRGEEFFLPPDPLVVGAFQRMDAWIETRQYTASAMRSFFSGADSFLVAQAIAYRHEVVTLEVPSPGSRKRIRIPDVCDGVGISWLKPFDMLEREGIRMVLR